MACNCPDAVVYTLRSRVQRELDKVLAIKAATGLFNETSKDVIGAAGEDIDAASGAIPTVSDLNYTDLLEYLTCPLTPLALGLSITDITSLDPNVALAKVKSLRTGEIENARKDYDKALEISPNAQLIKIGKKYVNELLRLRFDSASFSEAVIISASVLAVCPDEFAAGPYQTFANAITDFSFQNGVPSGLDQNAAAIVQKLINAENKFKALREKLT